MPDVPGAPSPDRFGAYEVLSEIGRGATGSVFLAYDPLLDRRVAVKVLAPHLAWDREFIRRFHREATSAARLKHPHIISIYEVGQEGDAYFFVMEYLPGGTLAERPEADSPMAPAEALTVLRPLASALDYAHRHDIVHRDVKPRNILFGADGQPTLTDFGMALVSHMSRITSLGRVVGTPAYMAPEQAEGVDAEARSDQYSLGVTAYQMLSGRLPFDAGSTPSLLYQVVHQPLPPIRQHCPHLPPACEAVFQRVLAKQPEDRYPTVSAFVEDLEGAVMFTGSPLPPPPLSQLFGRGGWGERAGSLRDALARIDRRFRWWGLVALAVVLAAVVFLALTQMRGSPPPMAATAPLVTEAASQSNPLPTDTAAPTASATPSQQPVSTPTTGAALATLTSAATVMPETTTAPKPTNTQTPAPSASPTSTPSPAPTHTPALPAPTPSDPPLAVELAAVELLAPADGAAVSLESVEFRWRWGPDCASPPAGYGFEVRLWPDRLDAAPLGVMDARQGQAEVQCDPATGVRTYRVGDLAAAPGFAGAGADGLLWDVVLVRFEPYQVAAAPLRPFTLRLLGQGGGDSGGGGQPTVVIE